MLCGALGGGLDGAYSVSTVLLVEKLFGLGGSLDVPSNEKAGAVLAGCGFVCSIWGEM